MLGSTRACLLQTGTSCFLTFKNAFPGSLAGCKDESGAGLLLLLLPSYTLRTLLKSLAARHSNKQYSYRLGSKMGFMARPSENGDGDDDEGGEADDDGA